MIREPQQGSTLHRLVTLLQRIEDGILISILLVMIMLATAQLVMRNLGIGGFTWADPLLRILVLWVGLVGAMIATRQNKHISVDIASKYLKDKLKIGTGAVTDIFTLLVSATIAWHAFRFVYFEIGSGREVAGIPVWVFESIIPIAFSVIAIRYSLFCLGRFKGLLKGNQA